MADLEERIEKLAAEVAFEVSSCLQESLGALVDELVRERLAAVLEQLAGSAPPKAKASRTGKAKASTPARPAKAKKVASTGPRCSKCGKGGHNARTCGTKPASDDEEDEEGPLARIERVLPVDEDADRAVATALARRAAQRSATKIDRQRPPSHPPAPDEPDDEPADTTPIKLAPARGPSCPHGSGAPASCSQCVLGAARVKTVQIVGGHVVVDGQAVRTTREQELAQNKGYPRGRPRKAA